MVAEGAAQLCRTLCRLCLTDQNSLEDLRNLGFAVLDKCENNENALQSEREKNNLRRALESKDDSLLHDFLVCFEVSFLADFSLSSPDLAYSNLVSLVCSTDIFCRKLRLRSTALNLYENDSESGCENLLR
ncbi:hypothetical protein D918_02296 [Trichuris suis]|nr:hypothetical protein D918_02296 [Trichuris suis]